MRRRFHHCNPVSSFAKGSQGEREQGLVGAIGTMSLGGAVWNLGRSAFERLRAEVAREPTVDEILIFVDKSHKEIDRFFEGLNQAALAGWVGHVYTDSMGRLELPIHWRSHDWGWQIKTLIRLVYALSKAKQEPPANAFGAHLLVATLLAIDRAASSSRRRDIAGFSESLLDAAWFFAQVEALQRHTQDTEFLMIMQDSARASDRAKIRHARDPKRQAKDFVRECWERWQRAPSEYKNPTAFARAMLDKQPDLLKSEVVVTRWERQWRKEAALLRAH